MSVVNEMVDVYIVSRVIGTNGKIIKKSISKKSADELKKSGHVYYSLTSFRLGEDTFFSLDEAIKAAEIIKQKRIDSLQKSLDKAKKMKFKVVSQ